MHGSETWHILRLTCGMCLKSRFLRLGVRMYTLKSSLVDSYLQVGLGTTEQRKLGF